MIAATGLTKRYGQQVALAGVGFRAARGETVAVVGASGSGKSTLLHCLAGLIRPDEGRVVIGDTSVWDLSDDARADFRRHQVGLVFQFGQLVAEMTALDNVVLPLLVDGVPRAEARRRARALFEQLEVEDVLFRRPQEMSGGQMQRVAICRAWVTSPSVILADEPTGSLDSLAADTVLTSLLARSRTLGTTVVLVTHEAVVAQRADRIITLKDGRVVEAEVAA